MPLPGPCGWEPASSPARRSRDHLAPAHAQAAIKGVGRARQWAVLVAPTSLVPVCACADNVLRGAAFLPWHACGAEPSVGGCAIAPARLLPAARPVPSRHFFSCATAVRHHGTRLCLALVYESSRRCLQRLHTACTSLPSNYLTFHAPACPQTT